MSEHAVQAGAVRGRQREVQAGAVRGRQREVQAGAVRGRQREVQAGAVRGRQREQKRRELGTSATTRVVMRHFAHFQARAIDDLSRVTVCVRVHVRVRVRVLQTSRNCGDDVQQAQYRVQRKGR